MPLEQLDNLVRRGALKAEAPAQTEIDGLLRSGQVRLRRVLDQAHRIRNIAEYEGHLDVDESLLAALIRAAGEVGKRVASLGSVPKV